MGVIVIVRVLVMMMAGVVIGRVIMIMCVVVIVGFVKDVAVVEDVDLDGGDATAVNLFDAPMLSSRTASSSTAEGTPASSRAPWNMSPEAPAKHSR
jgi:hypothetical protein